jgi:hypothetical protein
MATKVTMEFTPAEMKMLITALNAAAVVYGLRAQDQDCRKEVADVYRQFAVETGQLWSRVYTVKTGMLENAE